MIIAECCCNWHDLTEAKEMVKVASGAGPGVLAKFQLFDAEDDKGKPHYEWVKAHELTFKQAQELFEYGASIGIEVFFSVFGVKYVDWCEKIGVKRYKIAAVKSKCRNLVLKVWTTDKPVILSLLERESLSCFDFAFKPLILWASLNRPSTSQPIRFRSEYLSGDISYMKHLYYDGFSDHAIGLDAAKVAFARGAQIVEKHFVLKHDNQFPDDAWSMTPDELKELVKWENVCKEVIG